MGLPTFIPYPNVPAYPGVPQLVRQAQVAIAEEPIVAISLGTVENLLGSALQQAPRWGIFDDTGAQVGLPITSNASTLQALKNTLESQLTGSYAPVLSTVSFDYMKEMRVADFPTEGGSFASYNKVEMPGDAQITLAFSGSESDRSTFLNAIDAACKSTDFYTIVTPEVSYITYTFERYRYSRRSYRGATLLLVDVSLKEIRQVAVSFATVSPITNPQNASATPQVNSGMTQPQAPDQSTLLSITNKLAGLLGGGSK